LEAAGFQVLLAREDRHPGPVCGFNGEPGKAGMKKWKKKKNRKNNGKPMKNGGFIWFHGRFYRRFHGHITNQLDVS